MSAIERVPLLSSKRDIFDLLTLFLTIFVFSLALKYYHYKELTKFDSQLVNATVLKQYTKSKTTPKGRTKTYQVLKLKSDSGFTFYTIASKTLPNYKDEKVEMEIWAGKITFLQYIKGFFTFSKITKIYTPDSLRDKIATLISLEHTNKETNNIYQALFLAKSLPLHLQKIFSNLGISHLIAISGFHLGVLSALLFFIIKYPYKFIQSRYFPYRSYTRDTFIIITFILFTYLILLGTPPSLLRAFVMLLVGFILYDRGIEVISMQTLLLTVLLILSLFVELLFSIGFWLSVSGVFYIFLFLIHFKEKHKLWQFLLLPFWVYLLMLPYSLSIFSNFSLYHPLSILWTSLFTIFYPLAIALHLIGYGDLFDSFLIFLVHLDPHATSVKLNYYFLFVEILLSIFAIFKREALYLLLLYCFSLFIYAIYHIA